MRVVVDFDLCESNGLCMGEAPDVFDLDEQDYLHVLVERPAEDRRAAVLCAVAACPKQAISVQED